MDMSSPVFRRVFSSPPAYVALKSTEPWLLEYASLDMQAALKAAGFEASAVERNTARHKTVVSVKQ